ncbi:phage head-tail adapter protein [Clostridium perfringens]|uniref:phage head closure protein n=1 Tax=Clostridium perfringens TaxID=1502 RepID=UPI000F537ABE|nr:phage head closure protein [Clostridium perfringens]MDK3222219.1 phage head closure protein [Clostridium perfringens]RQN19169.1 phage head-tail adapter protein [Clostridium perfringens]
MNNRISIKKLEDKIVNGRRQKGVTSEFYNCWAEILDLYGQELYEAMAIKLENTIVFKIRYCKKLEELRNKENFIVEWQGHKYSIYYPDFMGYNKQYIKLKCKEVL